MSPGARHFSDTPPEYMPRQDRRRCFDGGRPSPPARPWARSPGNAGGSAGLSASSSICHRCGRPVTLQRTRRRHGEWTAWRTDYSSTRCCWQLSRGCAGKYRRDRLVRAAGRRSGVIATSIDLMVSITTPGKPSPGLRDGAFRGPTIVGPGGTEGSDHRHRCSKKTMGWEVHPDGLIDVLRLVFDRAPELPVYITENGAAYPDGVTAHGTVDDEDRRHFYEDFTSMQPGRRSSKACSCAAISPGACSTTSNGRSATAAASASCT